MSRPRVPFLSSRSLETKLDPKSQDYVSELSVFWCCRLGAGNVVLPMQHQISSTGDLDLVFVVFVVVVVILLGLPVFSFPSWDCPGWPSPTWPVCCRVGWDIKLTRSVSHVKCLYWAMFTYCVTAGEAGEGEWNCEGWRC